MRRRACAGWLAGSLLGRGVQAQERVWRIGILRPSAPPIASDTTWTGIPRALRDLGYVEGRNLVLEHRYASGNTDLLVPLARELAAARVDLVIAVSAGARSTNNWRDVSSSLNPSDWAVILAISVFSINPVGLLGPNA